MTAPLKLKTLSSYTGTAWTIKDIGHNEAQATKFDIDHGKIIKETVYEPNMKVIVLEQVSGQMGEDITQ